MAAAGPRGRVVARPLRGDDWPAIESLFGERGACGGCWCMAWRVPPRRWESQKGAGNRRAFKRLVTSGQATGCLAFSGDEPVGWCSVGPRAVYTTLQTKRSLRTDWDDETWSVTCFFVRNDRRGRGVSARLLQAAVRLARARGARRVEGYPVVPTKGFADGRMPGPFVWTGLPQIFERAGFRRLEGTPGARPIYVRRLGRGRAGEPATRHQRAHCLQGRQ